MSELPSHGTGYAESEVFMDVVEIFDTWNGEDTPDFSPVAQRLRERFNDSELAKLETATHAFHMFITAEQARRAIARNSGAPENEVER